jgi:tetratricopeptide (TPR) repeat protein
MKIFLSAVTGELGNYREELHRALLRKKLEPRIQEYFRPGTATLLEMLRDYIHECDRVILLVGERCGAFPTDEEVKVIGSIPEFDRYRAHSGQNRASYTQWEFFLARHFDKPIQVFFTGKDFKPKEPNSEANDLRTCQQAYRDWIKRLGLVRTTLTTPEKLIEDVLVDDLATHSGSRPNNLPYHSLGELFKGRETFLTQLKQSLRGQEVGRATAIVQSRAVHGLGGVGKTRLAVEYAWQHAADYTALLFVGADSPENLRRNLAALVAPAVLNLPEHDLPHEDVRMAAAVRWLEQHPGWLLILDNVDTPEAVKEVQKTLPQFRHGHVLITSRRSQWSADVEPLELDTLALADSADFLLERTATHRRPAATDRADAESLSRELDGLALALEQAAAYIAQRHCSIAEYLDRWRAHDRAVQEWYDDTVMNYPRSVATTWETTLEQLGPGEVALLRLFAWFAPDPIPLFVLDGDNAALLWQVSVALLNDEHGIKEFGHGKEPREALAELVKNATPRDALVNLVNYSMARFGDGDTFVVHRVVQEILRNRIPNERRKEWVEHAIKFLSLAVPRTPQDVRTWPQWNQLRAHVAICVTTADAEGIAEPTASLMASLATLLLVKALYNEAEPLLRRSLAIVEKNSGEEKAGVSTVRINLAALLLETNRVVEAETMIRCTLASDEKDFGVEHERVATSLNSLGQLLHNTHRLAEAEPVMHRALAISEKSLGPEHSSVATTLNNLARLLYSTGRRAEAEPLYLRALAIDEKNFGSNHPEVAGRLSNLAQIFQDTNRLVEAESMMRRVLAIDEQCFGPMHPQVARDLNNLAQLLLETKRPVDAELLMRRTLAIDEHFYESTHPNVVRSLHNLAEFLRETERFSEAEPLLRRYLAISEQIFGPIHPEVASRLGSLAHVLKSTNRLAEAEPLMRRALDIDLKSFGKGHPKVAIRLSNLGSLLVVANRLSEAEPLMRSALEILVECRGELHPESQSVSRNYLALLVHAGFSPFKAAKVVAEVVAGAALRNG